MKRITSIVAALAVAGMVLATGAAPVLASSIVTASQSNVTVGVGSSVYISVTSSGSQTLYLASIINTNALNATLSGNQLIISGIAAGSGQVQVCAQDGGCAIISVTVNSQGQGQSGNLYLVNGTLPNATAGQFYSAQLQVNGGVYPYRFYISSGSLPQGLTINSNGLISGTPVYSGTSSFSVQIFDNNNASNISNVSLFVSGNVLGVSVYNNGTLINDNGTIYITYKNNKIGFATWEAFVNLGYKLSNVISASTSAFGTTSLPVYSSANAHPWGSWVNSGQTIYFVHDQGLIPISTYDIFTNNGGNPSMVENINSSDLRMPILSVMTYNDSRLK